MYVVLVYILGLGLEFKLLFTATLDTYGIKLFGISFGSSPIKPLLCAPTGLKYLKQIILKSFSETLKSFNICSFIHKFGLSIWISNANSYVARKPIEKQSEMNKFYNKMNEYHNELIRIRNQKHNPLKNIFV